MALVLVNLNDEIRQIMSTEVDSDMSNHRLYFGKRLSVVGERDYPSLLKAAIQSHDDAWLTAELNNGVRLNKTEERRTRSGGVSTVAVPYTAGETLAEGEFNRFYIRALCQKAIKDGIPELIVYRAKQVDNPRSDSEAKVGTVVSPVSLYADLLQNVGVDTALGLPNGPNSGLSVRLP